MTIDVAIKADIISKSYRTKVGSVLALPQTSFSLFRGSMLLVTGDSGSGKSTLLKVCGLLVPQSSGRISIFGNKVETPSERQRRHIRNRHFSYLVQNGGLIDGMSVKSNVALSLTSSQLSRSEKRHRINDAVKQMGLEHRLNATVDTLSGGERIRAGLARSIASQSDILICDEPTAGLDPTASRDVYTALSGLRERGTAILLASHDPGFVDVADTVLNIQRLSCGST